MNESQHFSVSAGCIKRETICQTTSHIDFINNANMSEILNFFRAMIWYIYSAPTCSELLWWTTSWKLKSCICIPDKNTSFQCKFYKVCKQLTFAKTRSRPKFSFFQKCLNFYINMENGFNLSSFFFWKTWKCVWFFNCCGLEL